LKKIRTLLPFGVLLRPKNDILRHFGAIFIKMAPFSGFQGQVIPSRHLTKKDPISGLQASGSPFPLIEATKQKTSDGGIAIGIGIENLKTMHTL
jgi:hypothetical protein